ncbi:MAG: hypothetical protein IJ224_00690 [Lachnospiraceae bacterium]|nr:hypothetical protein [Lachnospiraceae bacterium]
MNRQLLETEKNYLVCSILMIIVGVVLCIINKVGLGACSIVIGIVFLIVFFAMVKKNNEEEKSKASGKDNE